MGEIRNGEKLERSRRRSSPISRMLRRQTRMLENPESEYVFTMLDDTFPGFKPGDPFVHRQHVMRKLCERAKVSRFGFHVIRHLTATILYKAGQPVSMIQKILRHQHPTTTERYLSSLGFQIEEMRDALKSLGNRGAAKVIQLPQKEKTL